MPKVRLMLVMLALTAMPQAQAQQSKVAGARVSDDVRRQCRAAIFDICKPGVVPDRTSIKECAVQNKDKLPAQCAPMFAGQQLPRS